MHAVETATEAGGTHLTGMHSCIIENYFLYLCILKNIVDQHNTSSRIIKLFNVRIQFDWCLLILRDFLQICKKINSDNSNNLVNLQVNEMVRV